MTKGCVSEDKSTELGCEGASGKGSPSKGRAVKQC